MQSSVLDRSGQGGDTGCPCGNTEALQGRVGKGKI